MTVQSPALTERDVKFQQYFTALAPKYSLLTSNTTKLVAHAALKVAKFDIQLDSLIHDNACGPGTATSAILEACEAASIPAPHILASDYTPSMVQALSQTKTLNDKNTEWSVVEAFVEDSQALTFENHKFDLSICNISVANFSNPLLAMKEIHRTLKPGGTAIVTNWKVFGFAELIAKARKRFSGVEAPQPQVAAEELMLEGRIAEMMEQAGWQNASIETHSVGVVVNREEDLAGAVEFMVGPYLPMVLSMPEVDKVKWAQAVQDTVQEEKAKKGGIVCEAWVVVARK